MRIRTVLCVLWCLLLFSCTPAFSGDMVFVRDGAVWMARTDGSEAHAMTGSIGARAPRISPDGSQVVFHSGRNERTGFGSLSILRVADGSVAPLIFHGIDGAEDADFSPDGNSVLFVALRNTREKTVEGFEPMLFADMSVAVAELATGNVHHVATHKNAILDGGFVYGSPCMSRDGMIAFQENATDASGSIVVVNPSGRILFRIPHDESGTKQYGHPCFSGDGRTILCHCRGADGKEADSVLLVDIRTGSIRRLAEGVDPVFAEEDASVLFVRRSGCPGHRTGKTTIWRIDLRQAGIPEHLLDFGESPHSR